MGASGSKPERAGEEEEEKATQRWEHCSPEKGGTRGGRECTSEFVTACQGPSSALRRCFLGPAIAQHLRDHQHDSRSSRLPLSPGGPGCSPTSTLALTHM